jgi:AraC-like DNA-binding protein
VAFAKRREPHGDGDGVRAIDVSRLGGDLLDATLRLVRLVETPEAYRALAPMVVREIVYRLLTGAQGGRMRHLATVGGLAHRMVRAVAKLQENFDKPLRIERVAKELGMSTSGFHAPFKAVTAMSPLRFQKQLRLQEARRLMLGENLDAAEAGYRVGYDDRLFQPGLQAALRGAANAGCRAPARDSNGMMRRLRNQQSRTVTVVSRMGGHEAVACFRQRHQGALDTTRRPPG